jgi:hypothetical protein
MMKSFQVYRQPEAALSAPLIDFLKNYSDHTNRDVPLRTSFDFDLPGRDPATAATDRRSVPPAAGSRRFRQCAFG